MSEITQRQKLEQGRAKHAYDAAFKANQDKVKDYKSYAKKVPMLVKTNGLGATLAFMKAKGKAYGVILATIEDWLKTDTKFSVIYNGLKGGDIIEKVIECDSQNYRAITIEVLTYLNWLKRFAEGLIKD